MRGRTTSCAFDLVDFALGLPPLRYAPGAAVGTATRPSPTAKGLPRKAKDFSKDLIDADQFTTRSSPAPFPCPSSVRAASRGDPLYYIQLPIWFLNLASHFDLCAFVFYYTLTGRLNVMLCPSLAA